MPFGDGSNREDHPMTKRKTQSNRPQSLFSFIVSSGYLTPTPEVKAFCKTWGCWWLLASKGRGKSLDRMREACVEAGYLYCDGHNTDRLATSTISDLLDAIMQEARGTKVYPMHDQPDDIGGSHIYGEDYMTPETMAEMEVPF